jgi:hypothetical protein
MRIESLGGGFDRSTLTIIQCPLNQKVPKVYGLRGFFGKGKRSVKNEKRLPNLTADSLLEKEN